ncbi:hypothetical protein SOVF_192620 [Spinacia oleracea]|uniref:Protein FANTASTIC FOUR 1 n=1 Tax=Spinacia oleracea TaxID=3562 RepID=A0A9R0IJ65_SPIOL|nr:protein FANTASTIC FOUR 1-like [Spinacia oleracea]KNA05194.1 hypothetical protein SOVF_192620 [Spinacia oleracea]
MTSVNNSVNSFFGLPPPLEEDHFSQTFHQTLGGSPPPPPRNLTLTFNNNNKDNLFKPIKHHTESSANFAGELTEDIAGDLRNSGQIGLMSCTESLGFESSDDIPTSSLDDLGRGCSNNDDKSNQESSSSSSSARCLIRRRDKGVANRWEERRFPPPLTSLSDKGRRNFTLNSVRTNGRLEIFGVMIEHPEILCATRENGRLRMHLVKTPVISDDEESEEEDEAVEARVEEEEDEVEEDEEGEVEREWRRTPSAAGMRRCYHHQRLMHVWGPQQNRFVTTM